MQGGDLKITIATVTYNAEKEVEKTILSVAEQTYKNIEYIIVDGMSTDSTTSIVESYSTVVSKYISEKDEGIYDAMNKALIMAEGDYLIFMGAGDVFCNSNVISDVVSKIKHMSCIYYGDVVFVPINKRHCGEFSMLKWCETNVCHQSIFYPKDVYKTHEYNLKYKVYADYAYNLGLLGEGYKFDYLNSTISFFDVNGFSSRTRDKEFEKDEKQLKVQSCGYIPWLIGSLYIIIRKMCGR